MISCDHSSTLTSLTRHGTIVAASCAPPHRHATNSITMLQVAVHLWVLVRATSLGDLHGPAELAEPDGDFEPNATNTIVWMVPPSSPIPSYPIPANGYRCACT